LLSSHGRLREGQRWPVDAQAIICRKLNVTLGVNRAREVIMKIPSLGHLRDKYRQQRRLIAD